MTDQLGERLRALGNAGAAVAPAVSGSALRASAAAGARLRRNIGLASLLTAVAAGTAYGVTRDRTDQPEPVANATAGPSASPPPPTAAPMPAPPQVPLPTAASPGPATPSSAPPVSATAGPTPAGPRRDVPPAALAEPARVMLAGSPRFARDATAAGLQPSLFDPCGGTRYPTDRLRVAGRSQVFGSHDDASIVSIQQVVAYADAAAARTAVTGYRNAVRGCPVRKPRGTEPGAAFTVEEHPTLGEESVLVREVSPPVSIGGDDLAVISYTVFVRRANAVTTLRVSGGSGRERVQDRRGGPYDPALVIGTVAAAALCYYGGCAP